jgi:CHAT domain-containing protein
MRINYLTFLLLFCSGLMFGQFTKEDSLRAIAYDQSMYENFTSAEENQDDTYAQWIEKLGALLSKRQREGPLTVELASNYHRMSLSFISVHPELIKPYVDTAIILRKAAGSPTLDIAQSHYEKGRVLQRTGETPGSLFYHEEALKIIDQAIDEESLLPELARRKIYFLKEAAYVAKLNGNYELAKLRLAQIPPLVSFSSGSDRAVYEALITEGDIEMRLQNFARADELYLQAPRLPFHQTRSPQYKSRLIQNRAYNKMLAGNYKEAEILYTAAKQELGLAVDNVSKAYEGINLIRLNILRGQAQTAANMLPTAELALKKLPGATYGEAPGELYLYSAEAASLLNQHNRADSLFAKAATALLEDPSLSGPALLPRITGNSIYSQTVLLDMLTKKREAFLRRNQLQNALSTAKTIDTLLRHNREQLSLTASLGQFISREAEQYTTAIDIALELYRITGKTSYRNEAFQFASGQKSNLLRRYLTSPGLAASLGVPDSIVQEKSDLELRILTAERALQNAEANDRNTLRDSLLLLNATADQLKRRINEEYPAFSQALRGFPAVDPDVAAASLEGDRLVVEYFLSADSVYVFTLSKASGLEVATLARPSNLTALIESATEQGEGATVLYDLLLAPLLAGRDGITRIQLIPDGELWKLPFAALKSNDRFLIQDYAVSFAYAAPLLFNEGLASRARAQTQKYLGYGISYEDLQSSLTGGGFRSVDLDDMRNMGRLPFAVREIKNAAKATGGVARLDTAATLQRFLSESPEASILHLSMHGLLRANPMESALVFRGEAKDYRLLKMGEVLGGHYPTELTILSACHTGGGSLQTSEGMQSIGRAFTAAGSRATITSTWAARDESTYEILSSFINELKAGEPKDISLQRAINTYLENVSPADRAPRNWANLTLTGDVQPLRKNSNFSWPFLGLLSVITIGGLVFWKRN